MLKVMRGHRVFKIGTLKRNGSDELGLVVLDPILQPKERPSRWLLYEAAENQLGDFSKETVRELIGSPEPGRISDIEIAVDAYCKAQGLCLSPGLTVVPRRKATTSTPEKQEPQPLKLNVPDTSYTALRARLGARRPTREELLQTSEWMNRRASILARDNRHCTCCGISASSGVERVILQVHHRYYVDDKLLWDYPDAALMTLCFTCHEELHKRKRIPVYAEADEWMMQRNMQPCSRCGGAGYFPEYKHIAGRICFKCLGARKFPTILPGVLRVVRYTDTLKT
jgi:hypothetical protein